MTVIAVPDSPTIACPPWCAVPHAGHVADLVNLEGFVIHWSAPRETTSAQIRLAATCYVDGTPDPSEAPSLYIDGAFHSDGVRLDDAETFAYAVPAAVAEMRACLGQAGQA